MKASTLQLTVERLSGALAKVEESEGLLRDKVQGLTEALTQSSASLASTQDKNVQLQKALTACEHDRQVLQVWGPQAQLWGTRWGAGPWEPSVGVPFVGVLAQYADWPVRGGWRWSRRPGWGVGHRVRPAGAGLGSGGSPPCRGPWPGLRSGLPCR